MNINEAFIGFLETGGFGTFGINMYIGGVPLDAPDKALWILAGGGSNVGKNETGEKLKNYIISIFYRNTDAKDVLDTLQEIEELLNANNCITLSGYNVVEVEATQFPVDQDLDNEDRTVGLVQATITVYNN
jgi:hypothetical protein